MEEKQEKQITPAEEETYEPVLMFEDWDENGQYPPAANDLFGVIC